MFGKNKLKKLFEVFNNNSEEFNFRKTIEELQELSLVLTQQLNKPSKDLSSNIIEEIAHVKIRLKYLETKYSNDDVEIEVNKKIKQLYKNVNNRRRSHTTDR